MGSDLSLWAAGDTTQSRSDVNTISITPSATTPSNTTRSSGAVVGAGVLSPEVVQLQPHCALPVVPRDGGTALPRRPICCATTTAANNTDPLQPFAGHLSHPTYAVTADGEPGGLADEAEPSSGLLEGSHKIRTGPERLHTCIHCYQPSCLHPTPPSCPSRWAPVSTAYPWGLHGVLRDSEVSVGSPLGSLQNLYGVSMVSLRDCVTSHGCLYGDSLWSE